MTYSLSGNYDGGSSNVFRLAIKKFDESAGSFSGEFHYLLTSISEPVSGHYHLYGDGRDETVLWFETSGGSWRWEAGTVSFFVFGPVMACRQAGPDFHQVGLMNRSPYRIAN